MQKRCEYYTVLYLSETAYLGAFQENVERKVSDIEQQTFEAKEGQRYDGSVQRDKVQLFKRNMVLWVKQDMFYQLGLDITHNMGD